MNKVVIKLSFPEDVKHLKGRLIGFDIETSSLDVMNCDLCVVQIFDPEAGVSHVLDVQNFTDVQVRQLMDTVALTRVCGQNLQFDLSVIFRKFGFIPKIAMDTYLLARMLQEKEQSLEDLASKYLPDMPKMVSLSTIHPYMSEKGFTGPVVHDLSVPEQLHYCGLDAYAPYMLTRVLKNKLNNKTSKVLKLELDLLTVIVKSRVNGLRVDYDKYKELVPRLEQEIVDAQILVDELAGRPLKANSSRDVVNCLFEELQLPIPPIKTPKGAISVNAEALAFLEGTPIVDAITNYKKVSAELSGSKKIT